MKSDFIYSYEKDIDKQQLIDLFKSVAWKTADYPNKLYEVI